MKKNKGFIFIETIIVICVLTISLMSLYSNYSKIITNTQELNTFDTTEYNYKTYFLKKNFAYVAGVVNSNGVYTTFSDNKCIVINSVYSDNGKVKICKLHSTSESDYIDNNKDILDAYIIDYLLKQDLNENNDDLFIAEYKKKDKQNNGEYFTYISSLNY